MKSKSTYFETDLQIKLKNPDFASAYLASALADNDLSFLPIALGDIAKAYGLTKLSEQTRINRRTLYKVFDKGGNPSFSLVSQIMNALNLQILIKPKKQKRNKAG